MAARKRIKYSASYRAYMKKQRNLAKTEAQLARILSAGAAGIARRARQRKAATYAAGVLGLVMLAFLTGWLA